jgi:hypothetical protein
MITMLPNSLIQQHNVNRLICDITIKVASENSSCSMVVWGARAACVEVFTGSVEASKAKHGQTRLPKVPHGILNTIRKNSRYLYTENNVSECTV